MTEFNPPIRQRETDELIAIAYGTVDDWQQLAIDQALEELNKRGISKEYRERLLDKWKKEEKRLEEIHQRQLEQNAIEVYSLQKMIYIFIAAPMILVGKWTVDKSLFELKRENYQRKFKQRLLLLISGTFFWFLMLQLSLISRQ